MREGQLLCEHGTKDCIYTICSVQLVWANTYAVGCGVSRCEELEGAEDGENAIYFLCYYGPG